LSRRNFRRRNGYVEESLVAHGEGGAGALHGVPARILHDERGIVHLGHHALVNVEGVDRPVEPEVEYPAVGGGGEAEVQLPVLALIPGVPGPHAHAGRGSRRC